VGVHRLTRMAVDAAPTRREWTWLVAAVAVATVVELIMAATALGTEDVRRWLEFAVGINDVGPWRVYGITFETSYNHPPATGAFLWLIGGLADQLRTFAFVLRLPAISASAVTPFVVFALLRPRSPGVALPAAVSVALSPALIAIAGFHGNTDPVVVMLALLSVYLLVERRAPAWSGIVIALAIGVKIVPVVVVPVLVLAAWHADRRGARRLLVGAGVTSLIIWLPALLIAGGALIDGVFGYAGSVQPWGLVEAAGRVGADGLVAWLRGPGRILVVVVSAGVPAWLVRRSPDRVVEAAAISLSAFLVLSTGFGMQYLAWAIAPAYLLGFGWATACNVAASLLTWQVYTRWSGGLPWDAATSSPFVDAEVVMAFVAWVCLVGVVASGVRTCLSPRDPRRAPPEVRSAA
jgi:hypothetical protein